MHLKFCEFFFCLVCCWNASARMMNFIIFLLCWKVKLPRESVKQKNIQILNEIFLLLLLLSTFIYSSVGQKSEYKKKWRIFSSNNLKLSYCLDSVFFSLFHSFQFGLFFFISQIDEFQLSNTIIHNKIHQSINVDKKRSFFRIHFQDFVLFCRNK